ncbi:hypothetical protein DWB61_16585 [Ancylomarina euxinus]|uniref:Uncharacterized protein n=1 Tax=Ancylomarina euxinus TaxID=2283627 RepID=A0A425XWV8_9BACT|nr:DUF6261 family protein [Ancylomarina euxinus]MCZ4696281.1 DUF6261 family protein [Ancylomarina euxinus]MUP16689.1 hypothetical protein [Ancylomarina euxinus]RRG19137.1 hypothetical protein DWB61_16585 [Ancylomarina euxinus]
MFSSIHLTLLRHNEFIQFITNLSGIINANDLETLKLKSESDDLTALLATITALYKPDLGSQLTKLLEQDDERRDRALVGIQSLIEAYTNHYDEAKKEAALALALSLKKFGTGIARQNYQAETATITAIIEEWKRETNLIAGLSKLSLNEWVGELGTANSQFDTHYIDRVKEDAAAPDVKLIALRKEAIQSYRTLTNRIQAFATIGEEPAYAAIINECNSLIEKYNSVVNARSKKENEEVSAE